MPAGGGKCISRTIGLFPNSMGGFYRNTILTSATGIADFELILEKNRRNGPNGTYVRGRSHKTLATIIFRFINTMLGVERHLADPQWINRGENQLRHERDGFLTDKDVVVVSGGRGSDRCDRTVWRFAQRASNVAKPHAKLAHGVRKVDEPRICGDTFRPQPTWQRIQFLWLSSVSGHSRHFWHCTCTRPGIFKPGY